jgi:hypothetical protein
MPSFRVFKLSLFDRAYLSNSMQISGVRRGVSSQIFAHGAKSMAIRCRSSSSSGDVLVYNDVVQSGDFVNGVRSSALLHKRAIEHRESVFVPFMLPLPHLFTLIPKRCVRQHHAADDGVDVCEQHQGFNPGNHEAHLMGPLTKAASLWIFSWTKCISSQKSKLRMDTFLSSRLPALSRTRIKDCIQGGQVRLNNSLQKKPGRALRLGDSIACELPEPRVSSAHPENIAIDVVFEDSSVLVINKPAGAVSS